MVNHRIVAVFISLITYAACEPKICEKGGGGLAFPLFGDSEADWPDAVRGILYLVGLIWCFVGVAIIADVFMGAIERITSKERVLRLKNKATVSVRVWNETVANLTLMALGSSAPEILLAVIEICGNNFFSGALVFDLFLLSVYFLFIFFSHFIGSLHNCRISSFQPIHHLWCLCNCYSRW